MQWFIARVDHKFAETLRRDLDGVRPTIARMTKPSRKRQPVESHVPIFPGWLFVRYVPELYHTIRDRPGVKGVVKYGRLGTLLLTDEDIAGINALTTREIKEKTWHIGDRVKVQGLLGLHEGVITEIRRENAVVDLGGHFPITINRCALIEPGL